MKSFLTSIGIIFGIWLIVYPYYSLGNLSYLSKLKDISNAIKECTKEIRELVRVTDELRKEVEN